MRCSFIPTKNDHNSYFTRTLLNYKTIPLYLSMLYNHSQKNIYALIKLAIIIINLISCIVGATFLYIFPVCLLWGWKSASIGNIRSHLSWQLIFMWMQYFCVFIGKLFSIHIYEEDVLESRRRIFCWNPILELCAEFYPNHKSTEKLILWPICDQLHPRNP